VNKQLTVVLKLSSQALDVNGLSYVPSGRKDKVMQVEIGVYKPQCLVLGWQA